MSGTVPRIDSPNGAAEEHIVRDMVRGRGVNAHAARKALRTEFAADVERARASMPGPDYYDVLAWIHHARRPRTYLEIGVRDGESLSLAQPETRCVGVDPRPGVSHAVPPDTTILATTSNDFFRSGAAQRHFGATGIDLAFIDGLHIAEQVVQDFVYTLPLMNDGGIILLHDVMPLRPAVATRDRTTLMWVGDVWKAALAIRSCFPDLTFRTVACRPSGLMLIKVPPREQRTQCGALWDRLFELLPRQFDGAARIEIAETPRLENDAAAVRAFVAGEDETSGRPEIEDR